MKKALVKCHEGDVFVESPNNTSKEIIINAVKYHHGKIQLANVEYLTETKWSKEKIKDSEKGQEFLWDRIETIKL